MGEQGPKLIAFPQEHNDSREYLSHVSEEIERERASNVNPYSACLTGFVIFLETFTSFEEVQDFLKAKGEYEVVMKKITDLRAELKELEGQYPTKENDMPKEKAAAMVKKIEDLKPYFY